MAKRKEPKVPATKAPKQAKVEPITIRLDLMPKDYERLDHQARKRGLNKASIARMIVLEWLDEQDAKEGGQR